MRTKPEGQSTFPPNFASRAIIPGNLFHQESIRNSGFYPDKLACRWLQAGRQRGEIVYTGAEPTENSPKADD